MKFCDIKIVEMQGKTAKAGWQAPGEPVCRRRSAHFHVTRRARQKKRPDGFKAPLAVVFTTSCGPARLLIPPCSIAGSPFLLRAEFMNLMSFDPSFYKIEMFKNLW